MNNIESIAQTHAAKFEAETVRLAAEKKRIEREAEQAARAAAQKPLAKIAESHAATQKSLNEINELISRREILVEQIKVARIDVAQQTDLAAELERCWQANFGHRNMDIARQNPSATEYGHAVHNRLDRLCAQMVLPRLTAWLAEKQSELENIEARIVEITGTGK